MRIEIDIEDILNEINLDDLYDSFSDKEKYEFVRYLKEYGFFPQLPTYPNDNYKDSEWEEIINKLAQSRIQLSLEEEETIKKIANRL
jgi:hypothetical protein